MSYNTAQPHIASYVLVRKNGKIAFVLRSNTDWMNNFYGLPSGKVEKGESYSAAAAREAKEEIGIDIDPSDLTAVHICHRYEPSSQANDWVDTFFEAAKWKGEPFNAEPEIHSKLEWLDLKNLPDNVIISVKYVLEQIEAGQTYSEYGWNS